MTPEQRGALAVLANATHLELDLATRGTAAQVVGRERSLHAVLNGAPATAVNKIIGRLHRRRDGIFFSGETWGEAVVSVLPIERCSRILDPACGIGDLLLAAARRLPIADTVNETLDEWCQRLVGQDLHGPLLAMAWHRLQALAVQRVGDRGGVPILDPAMPPSFMVGNALARPWALRAGDAIVMNPPFQAIAAPKGTVNSAGKVTAALPFLERAFRDAPPGVHVAALVPEVLRSGSRYARLREWMNERSATFHFEAKGLFSKEANIDVALLVALTRASTAPRPIAARANARALPRQETLGERCRVTIGAVVPHRTKVSGPQRPYLDVGGAPAWGEVWPARVEAFDAVAHRPPFVVVRRTSGPKDRQRIRATLVRGKHPVTVENHLVVLIPRARTIAACNDLMAVLARPATQEWINGRIRCRHLTVSALRELPVN